MICYIKPIKTFIFVKKLFQRGEEALHLAAKAGDVDVVKCLIEHGAQVDAKNSVRMAVYIYAKKVVMCKYI